jgi:hypothetical protein
MYITAKATVRQESVCVNSKGDPVDKKGPNYHVRKLTFLSCRQGECYEKKDQFNDHFLVGRVFFIHVHASPGR